MMTYYEFRERDLSQLTQYVIDSVKKFCELSSIYKNATFRLTEPQSFPVGGKSVKIDLSSSAIEELEIVLTYSQKKEQELPQKILLPKVVNRHYFYLGGHYKIPIAQLFDQPFVYLRNNSGDELLQFRSNLLTFAVTTKDDDVVIYFGKKKYCKLLDFLNYLYIIESKVGSVEKEIEKIIRKLENKTSNMFNQLVSNLQTYEWKDEDSLNLLVASLSKQLGFTEDVFERNMKLFRSAIALDIFVQKFFTTDTVFSELLYQLARGLAVPENESPFISLRNKRLRISEYILSVLQRRLFELLQLELTARRRLTPRTTRSTPLISQNLILSKCISASELVSEAVGNLIYFDIAINPMGELSLISQTSQAGVGMFKKESVPLYLRGLDDSFFGKLCPVDTPDKEGCGVINSVVEDLKLDDLGRFVFFESEKKRVEKNKPTKITSWVCSLIPFSEYDDPTRLQMAISQIKQSIATTSTELPWIRSGNERSDLLKYSNFVGVARYDGRVTLVTDRFLVVIYIDKEGNAITADIFQLGTFTTHLSTVYTIKTDLKQGDHFKKGDILCYCDFVEKGELKWGTNLLTAVTTFKHNFEDGIILSESAAKKLSSKHAVDLSFVLDSNYILLSLESERYKPLPEIGDILNKNQTYCKMRTLPTSEGIVERLDLNPEELKSPDRCQIVDLRVYPNKFCKDITEYEDYLINLCTNQDLEHQQVLRALENNLSPALFRRVLQESIIKIIPDSLNVKYSLKDKEVDGIYFKILGVSEKPIVDGDKLANRHGNKGIVSKILRDEEMPVTEDGRRIEVIINPMGIVSRMNVGQLYELHTGETLYQLRNKLSKLDLSKGKQLLKKFLDILYGSDNKVRQECKKQILEEFEADIKEYGYKTAVERLYLLAKPFDSFSYENLRKTMEFVGAKEKQKLYCKDFEIESEVAVGYMYFSKLIHRSEEKFFARSVGPYSKKTMQPVSGRVNKGGHRFGEMEVWCLAAHGATTFLDELLNEHSDFLKKKIDLLTKILQLEKKIDELPETEDVTESLHLLNSYLMCLNLKKVETKSEKN